jgi:hypothetical protein
MKKKTTRKTSDTAKLRNKRIVKKVLKGKTIRVAAREEGLSPSYADSGHLTSSRGWQELMDEFLPDDDLIKLAKDGLSAEQTIILGGVPVEVPDMRARHKFLETALKLKSRFPNDKVDINHTILDDPRTDEEIEREIEEARKFFTKQ